jgi:hypothetical protein
MITHLIFVTSGNLLVEHLSHNSQYSNFVHESLLSVTLSKALPQRDFFL